MALAIGVLSRNFVYRYPKSSRFREAHIELWVGMPSMTDQTLLSSYDYRLVVLSVLIAILAPHTLDSTLLDG